MLLTFVGMTIGLGFIVGGLVYALHESFPGLPRPSASLDDPRNPLDILYGFGALALFLPVVWVTVRAGGRKGTIHSVFGHFRWGLLRRAAWVVVPVFMLVSFVPFLLLATLSPGYLDDAPAASTLLWIFAIAVLIVPLQSAAEEYIFRGLIPQMIGTWLRSPLWGVLLATPLFVLGHGYDWVGLIEIAVFALCLGYLTWKSGGIEIPVLIHASNNVTVTFVAPFSDGLIGSGSVSPLSVAFSVIINVCLTLWLSRFVSKQYGLKRFEPVVRPRDYVGT